MLTMQPDGDSEGKFGAWNPGIQSQIPQELRHLATVFRPENVFTSLAAARELRDLTGLTLCELAAFRPERLALHEVLIRVTADFAVPDGSRIGDLGVNFREIVRQLLARHVGPQSAAIVGAYERMRKNLEDCIAAALRDVGRGWGPGEIAKIQRMPGAESDPMTAAAAKALARVMSALFATQGQAWGTHDLIKVIATGLACNDYGSEVIGQVIAPVLIEAARVEGYRLLPRQEHPVVINTKGASASGKSTLRPLQKKLTGDIGLQWSDFALISPDIWRKQLLDYASLGRAHKYAGACTAEELQIVDQKLDRYMARKQMRGEMSHLLIDRFRFDSFAPDSGEAGSNLLTRFGQSVFLFFMITPPEMLVERAWNRGLEFGRYKAVDDTLAHAVEAYSGIPDVFFTWILRGDKRIQFEFLDNTVRFGERPRTVAFGDNETFNVLDVNRMLDIQRYARLNVDAQSAEKLYRDPGLLAAEKNVEFLRRCVKGFRRVNFADQASGKIYLKIESGIPLSVDAAGLRAALANANTLAGVRSVAPGAITGQVRAAQQEEYLRRAGASVLQTLGQWGEREAAANP
jgi:hypothetical protein